MSSEASVQNSGDQQNADPTPVQPSAQGTKIRGNPAPDPWQDEGGEG